MHRSVSHPAERERLTVWSAILYARERPPTFYCLENVPEQDEHSTTTVQYYRNHNLKLELKLHTKSKGNSVLNTNATSECLWILSQIRLLMTMSFQLWLCQPSVFSSCLKCREFFHVCCSHYPLSLQHLYRRPHDVTTSTFVIQLLIRSFRSP